MEKLSAAKVLIWTFNFVSFGSKRSQARAVQISDASAVKGKPLTSLLFLGILAMANVGCYSGSGSIPEPLGFELGGSEAPGLGQTEEIRRSVNDARNDEVMQECLEWIENHFFIFYDVLAVDSLAPDNSIIDIDVNRLVIEPSDQLYLHSVSGVIESGRSEYLTEASYISGDLKLVSRHIGDISNVYGDLNLNTLRLDSLSRVEGNSQIVLHELDFLNKYKGNLCINAQKIEVIKNLEGHMTYLGRGQNRRQAQIDSVSRFSGILNIINADLNQIYDSRACDLFVSQGNIGSVKKVAGKITIEGGDILEGIENFEGEIHLNGGQIRGGLKNVSGTIFLGGGSIAGDLENVTAEIIP